MSQTPEIKIKAAYEAYDRHPLGEPGEWGSLAAFYTADLLRRQETQAGRVGGP